MADNANWYVVHTYSGYENTVKATIEKYVENRHLQDVILEISIPMETVTEITDNGPKDVERKVAEGDTLALRRWGALRILMITVPLLLNTIGYYLFMNTTFGYMALILLICLPFVYTSPKK